MPENIETIKRWHTSQKTAFERAHAAWKVSDQLVHRELRPVIDPKLGNMAAGADYRTPDIEEEEQRYIEFLSQKTVEFDARPGEDTPTGKKEADNIQLWDARQWAQINKGARVTEMWGAGQVRHGLKAWRFLTRNLEEPDEGVDREEWMQSRDDVFYVRDANNTTVTFEPIIGPYNRITMEYELTVAQAKDDYRIDGADLGDGYTAGKHYTPIHDAKGSGVSWWPGDEEDPERDDKPDTSDKTLTVTVVEYQDASKPCPVCPDKHPLWVGAEYVRGGDKAFKDAEKVREYTLPWKKWPSIRVCEGRTSPLDRDPHDHFRPLEIRLLVEAATWNWANAMLLAVANEDMTSGFYAQLNTNMPQEAVGLLSGASNTLEPFDKPDNTTDKVDVLPAQVLKWPSGLSDALIALRDSAYERFVAAKINPILYGETLDEAKQMPGISFGLALRQARIPFNRLQVKQDDAILDMFEDIHHAILFWDAKDKSKPKDAEAEGSDVSRSIEQRFYVRLDGGEGGTPGEKVYLSASRLGTHPQISISSNAEQLAEQQEREQMAWDRYDKGADTWHQYLKALGYKDMAAQDALLDEDIQRRESRQAYVNARINYMLQISADTMDTDPSFLISNPLGVVASGTRGQTGTPSASGNTASAVISRASMGGQPPAQGG